MSVPPEGGVYVEKDGGAQGGEDDGKEELQHSSSVRGGQGADPLKG